MTESSLGRLNRLREVLIERSLDACVITDASNVDWVTGIQQLHDEEGPHAVLVTASQAVVITDSRYDEVARRLLDNQAWRVVRYQSSLIEELITELAAQSCQHVALEDSMSYRSYIKWAEKLVDYDITPVTDMVELLRWTKDNAELASIRTAQAITDKAFEYILDYIEPGRTERDIALELEFELRRQGADALAFPSIVASGPNGSLPHAHPSDRVIERGDFVTLDFGARFGGYCADMTRTVCVGSASEEMKAVYDVVLSAQIAAVNTMGPAVSAKEVDDAARTIIVAAGFGEYFGHGTGHGVGLAIHEGPTAGPRTTDILGPGHVVTVEPGIYVPGKLGVRIEDLVVVTESGFENLTNSPKHLIEL